jgi:hypothetical protein
MSDKRGAICVPYCNELALPRELMRKAGATFFTRRP